MRCAFCCRPFDFLSDLYKGLNVLRFLLHVHRLAVVRYNLHVL